MTPYELGLLVGWICGMWLGYAIASDKRNSEKSCQAFSSPGIVRAKSLMVRRAERNRESRFCKMVFSHRRNT